MSPLYQLQPSFLWSLPYHVRKGGTCTCVRGIPALHNFFTIPSKVTLLLAPITNISCSWGRECLSWDPGLAGLLVASPVWSPLLTPHFGPSPLADSTPFAFRWRLRRPQVLPGKPQTLVRILSRYGLVNIHCHSLNLGLHVLSAFR